MLQKFIVLSFLFLTVSVLANPNCQAQVVNQPNDPILANENSDVMAVEPNVETNPPAGGGSVVILYGACEDLYIKCRLNGTSKSTCVTANTACRNAGGIKSVIRALKAQ